MDKAFDRRSLMQSIALLVGASTLTPQALAAIPKGKRFLPLASFKVLTAVADTIIPATDTPGAVAAGVPATFDALLANWASATRRSALIGALGEIDVLAKATYKKGFAALTPARRKALLSEHDKAALKPGPAPKEKLTAFQAMIAGPPVANPGYLKLKELVIALYYTSEIAMTQEQIYEHVPGKFVPSLKVTPATRPFAGLGGPF